MVEFVTQVDAAWFGCVVDAFLADPTVGISVALCVELLALFMKLCFELLESARTFSLGRHDSSSPASVVVMVDNDVVLLTAQDGPVGSGRKLIVYANRYEYEVRRALTGFLTKKRETYAFKSIRDVEVKGGTLTIRWGPMTVRRYQVGRKKAKQIAEIIHRGM